MHIWYTLWLTLHDFTLTIRKKLLDMLSDGLSQDGGKGLIRKKKQNKMEEKKLYGYG